MYLFMRLPPEFCIPRQFRKESEIKLYVGIVVVVLSKFRTFTVARFISITSPSAPNFSKVTQSPILTKSFTETCMLATNPRIVSLKIKITIAEMAPKVANSFINEVSKRIMTIVVIPKIQSTIMNT
ncbi:hypothetical protein D3C86_1369390 [compost metagenome]